MMHMEYAKSGLIHKQMIMTLIKTRTLFGLESLCTRMKLESLLQASLFRSAAFMFMFDLTSSVLVYFLKCTVLLKCCNALKEHRTMSRNNTPHYTENMLIFCVKPRKNKMVKTLANLGHRLRQSLLLGGLCSF